MRILLDDNNSDEIKQYTIMNKILMKLDERKRNFPSIITVDDALMNTIQRKKNDQLGSKLSFFFLKD